MNWNNVIKWTLILNFFSDFFKILQYDFPPNYVIFVESYTCILETY